MALGALTSIFGKSKEIDGLCGDIISHCTDHVIQRRPFSGLNVSQLLRALSRKVLDGTSQLTQLLIWRLIEEHESFAVIDFVSSVHSAVTMHLGI